MKLAFGIPWSSPFAWQRHYATMMNLARPARARNVLGEYEPLETRFFVGQGWCPARRHADLCEQALAWGADLICVMGADQVHPEDMLTRLVARWDEGYEVISALVPARGYVAFQDMQPFQRMAWRLKPGASSDAPRLSATPQIEVIDPDAAPVQEINFIGSGVLMFHRDHLLALRQPWFSENYNPVTMQRLASMDTTFVWRLQTEAGAHVYVDTTIDVRHIHAFEIDPSYSERFADWAQQGVGDPRICNWEHPLDEQQRQHQAPATAVGV